MSSRYQRLNTAENDDDITTIYMYNDVGRQQAQQQRHELEDTFGECLDDEEEDHTATDVLLPQQPPSTNIPTSTTYDYIPSISTITPVTTEQDPLITPIENEEPERLQQQQQRANVAILPVTNDGVFANMSAKPESDSMANDDIPPTYEEAAADATPPYWPTTIIAPAIYDGMTLVEGMPVGSIFAFFWNLLVSASFQFVGFMLTYLLHTSHAAKQGSRAGLGVSLVQMGFYIRSRGTLEDDQYYYEESSDGSQTSSKTSTSSSFTEDSTDAAIVAYFLMMLGWFLVLRSMTDYFRAKQMEKIISAEPATATTTTIVVTESPATASTQNTTRTNATTPENMV